MGGSNDDFRQFLDNLNNSSDELERRVARLLERDRFGVRTLDDRIKEQLEQGGYGDTAKDYWFEFKGENFDSQAV
jgi:hypothetical protein